MFRLNPLKSVCGDDVGVAATSVKQVGPLLITQVEQCCNSWCRTSPLRGPISDSVHSCRLRARRADDEDL